MSWMDTPSRQPFPSFELSNLRGKVTPPRCYLNGCLPKLNHHTMTSSAPLLLNTSATASNPLIGLLQISACPAAVYLHTMSKR